MLESIRPTITDHMNKETPRFTNTHVFWMPSCSLAHSDNKYLVFWKHFLLSSFTFLSQTYCGKLTAKLILFQTVLLLTYFMTFFSSALHCSSRDARTFLCQVSSYLSSQEKNTQVQLSIERDHGQDMAMAKWECNNTKISGICRQIHLWSTLDDWRKKLFFYEIESKLSRIQNWT